MQRAEFASFARALTDADCAIPRQLFREQGADLADRFAIYRNNVHASLIDALADRFPIVLALVGTDFFRAMARCYVQQHKPQAPQLSTYGATLPQFIASFAGAATLPWLADVATLEDAWQSAWCAADAEPLALRDLAGLAPEVLATTVLRAHPATRLIRSPWPVASIWQKHQQQSPDLGDLAWQAEDVLITRPAAEIRLLQLPPAAAAFAQALLADHSIEAAASAAAGDNFDPGAALALLLDAGAFTEISAC